MKKKYIFLVIFFGLFFNVLSQTGTEFWFAPPNVTDNHNPADSINVYITFTCLDTAADITISQPANPGFIPITFSMAANSSHREYMGPYVYLMETKPTNTVLNTGLLIQATHKVSVYYEYDNQYNPDIFALKGKNALGQEFYIPLQNYAPFYNNPFTDTAYASFDIVATEDNTSVLIYPPRDVNGHPGLQQFTVNLNRGQTYSCAWTGANYQQPSTHPYGTAVVSDKPIAISIKDDSDHNPSGGCYDLMGDQIVPTDIIGQEYIVVQGQLNGGESIFILATQNNTEVYINGSSTPIVNLFAGETYRYDITGVGFERTYVYTTEPVYVTHVTGFGCEEGVAILPPLNCAGSKEVSFSRSTSEGFFLTLLVKNGSQGDFVMTPSSATIDSTLFDTVPGTGGVWVAAIQQFNTTEIPVGTAFRLTNTSNIFAMGIINGGTTSGCRYGYFSEFVSEIFVNAGSDQTICANSFAQLNGSVSGGVTTGQWSSNGSGTFSNPDDLNATYTPSYTDGLNGSVILTLTSTGMCFPTTDQMTLTFDPAPTADAGTDQSVCSNNPDVTLNGTITVASGAIWSGGSGTFAPNNTTLNAVYSPTVAEISAGSLMLYLTTTGNGSCNAVIDSMTITFTPAPTVNAGVDQTVCANNPDVTLNGTGTVATAWQWNNGTGSYNPGNTALNTIYTPSALEISNGSVTLTLITTAQGNCNAVSDDITISFSPAPVVDAGADQTKCANNAATTLNGNVSAGATTGTWSGGSGSYSPDNNTLNAVYSPTATEIANGSVTLTLTSTGNGSCIAESDQMTISFTPAPTVDAGVDQTVCANNPDVTLNGSITVASGAIWSGGSGTFTPNNTTLNAVYSPTAAEIASGSLTLYLTTTGNGTCVSETDSMIITYTPAPTVNAGIDQTVCANNPDVTLNGTGTVATAWQWTNGTGSYNPGNTALNTIYTPSAVEIANGSVTLTLITTAQGNCNAVSDDITITFSPSPVVDAGIDQTVCANNSATTLNGSVSGGATTGAWSGGSGTFSPDNTTLNAVYTPSATEIANGSVTLTLTSTGNGSCIAETDQMTISFTPAPTVDAGVDQTVCANNADVTLNGSITVASGAIWSGGAGTFTPNNTTLNAVYSPTAAEIASGSLTLYLTTTGNGTCVSETDSMTISFTPAPTVNAGIDQTVCANNADITLNGTGTVATAWQWTNGTGSYNPGSTALNTIYSPSAAEISSGSITLTLITTAQGNCNAVSDDITITFSASPVVDAGADQIKCGNNAATTLNGSVSGGATTGTWSGGLGTFAPDNNTLNAVYSPTATEISNGSVTLTLTSTGNGSCIAETDQMTISFSPAPTADANIDQTVCGNNSDVPLDGSITVASGGIWSGGSGTFTPDNTTLNATYTPTATEISAGTVSLTLTTTGNGTCNSVSDQMDVTIDPSPIVSAGADQNACENNPSVVLTGSVVNAGGGLWSGGAGSFSPNNTTLTATYTPTAAEIAGGSVTLTLTSTANGNCLPESDDMTIYFDPAPTVDAGTDQTLCANNATVYLNGSVTIASGGQWTGGLGVFSPDNNTLNAVYTPTATEIANGVLILHLTSTGNGNCNAVQDDVQINFTASPTVDAGFDQTVCANNSDASLSGTVTIASGGTWSGGLGTFLPNNNSLNVTYTPSASEITAGNVTLTLTTTGNGNCVAESDDVNIVINPSPVVNAGVDEHSCENNPDVQLNGSVLNAGGGVWSGGSGTFNPNNSTLNAIYTPSAPEIATGSLQLTLTSSLNGTCNLVSDDMVIYIDPAPIVDAGADQTVCANNADVVLNGSVTNASGGTWSGGLGTFSPNNSVLNATYTPTATEIANGWVTLTLTSTGNGTCNPESDDMTIFFTPAPTVDAGNAIDACANNSDATLNGNITIATGGIWSDGTGTFSPDNTTLNAVYSPSAAEINAGSVTLTLTSTGNGTCLAVNDTVNININPSPLVDAGTDQNVCVDNMVANLSGSVSGITNTGQWSTNGTGTFVPNNTTLNASYICSSQDSLAGSVILTLTSTGNGVCLPVSDSMTVYILPAGIADAGTDQTVCANNDVISLNGSVTGGAVSGVWSTSGSGVFVPNDSTLNANYIPSTGDTAVGTVTLTLTANSCNLAQDDMTVTITPAPYINAGTDQTVCVDNLDIQLNGEVHGGTSTAVWSTTGTGSFDPNNTTIDAIYHASTQDSLNLGVDLILTSTNNGNCLAESDTIHIDILPAGIVNAGQDQTMCSNNVSIQLNGSVSGGATEGQWGTSGSGTFVPTDTSMNAQYIPSSADLATGSVTLVLSATNSCNFAFDALQVNFTPAPTADAGSDQSLCGNNADLSLNGSVTVALGGIWNSSGSGTFVPDNTTLNAVYVPSQTDINNGGVIITLTTTGNGGCNAESDSLDFTITPSPNVDAGINQTVCITAPSTQLFGYVSGGTSTGQWTTMGSGSFSPNDSDLNAYYIFSAADSAAGSVQIVLTSTNNGNCLVVSDTMTISFGNTTFAYAGVDQTVCANNLDVQLNGLVSGGTSTGVWSTTGSGTFSNATDLNAIYTCSTADSVLGTVDLILTTTNNGGCTAGVDTITVTIVPVPVVSAGTDIDVCLGIDTVALGGTVQNTVSLYWETLGSGSFYPSDTVLNNYYLPSLGDSVNGLATLVLHSTGNQSCSESSDTMVIHFMVPLTPDFTNSLACNHHTVQFSDNSTVTTGSITGYEWNFEGNLVYAQDTSYIFDTTGTFDVSLTVTSSLGCSYSVTKPVEVHDIPQVSFTNTTSCYLDAFDFTDLSSISSGTVTGWTWTFGNGDTSNLQNPAETFANAGTYDVMLTATSNAGCASSTMQQVDVYLPPTANFSYVYNCQNSSVAFTDNSTATGQTVNSWNWNFGDGNNATDQNPTHVYSTLGGQTVTLIVGSSQNCTDTTVQYLNLQYVTADFSFVSQCKYDSILFTNLSNLFGDTTTTYYWTFDDGNTSILENPSHLYQLEGTYDVTLQITTQSGCQDTATHFITVYPVPNAGFDYSAEELATGYTILFTDLSTGANSWQWNFGDVITSSIQHPEHIYNESGNFTVVQVVSNEYDCVDTASTVLIIAPGEKIYPPKLPNAFSPNGDGQNDVFYPRGGPFTSIDFSVYNTWGEKIFNTTDITGGWDGTKKGVDQPIGTYVWTLKAVTTDGKEYTKSGDVTLIR